jgi:F-type H+-transporting ATPase subunit delta
MVSKAARRYANALLVTAIEQDILEKVKEDTDLIRGTIKASSELRLFLRSPIVKPEMKRAALDEIFEGKIQQLTNNLIGILSEKGREDLLAGICDGFIDLYNKHHNILEVDVATAFELADDQQSSLLKELQAVTGKTVHLTVVKNEDLIGGLTVRIADTVIDGSARYKLNQLKEKFTTTAVV